MVLTPEDFSRPSVFEVRAVDLSQARPERNFQWLPIIAMGVVVIVWGVGPPTTKLITASPLIVTFIRFGLSAPFLVVLLWLRGSSLRLSILKKTALPGICFGINLIFVVATLQEATVSVLAVIGAMNPALLLMISVPLLGERASLRQLIFTLVGVGGSVVVILGAGSELRSSWLGVIFSSLSLVTFSAYFVLTRKARSDSTSDIDPIEWMAGINIWAFMATVPPVVLLAGRKDWAEFGGNDWLWMAIVAFITGVFGHVLMTWVHGHMEVARSSLYLLTMHLVAIGLAWPIHDEAITITQGIGGLVVLGAVATVIATPASGGIKAR